MARRQQILCKDCGKPIRFVRSGGRIIAVDKAPVYIRPMYNCSDVYYRGNGTVVKGIYDSHDGSLCYRPHTCVKKPVTV